MQQDDAALGAAHRMSEVGRVAHRRRVSERRVPHDQILDSSSPCRTAGVQVVRPVRRTEQREHGSTGDAPEDPLGARDLLQLARVGQPGHERVRHRVVADPEATRRDVAPGRRCAIEDTGIWEYVAGTFFARRMSAIRLQLAELYPSSIVSATYGRYLDPWYTTLATAASANGGINVPSRNTVRVATATRDSRGARTQLSTTSLRLTLAPPVDPATEPWRPRRRSTRPTQVRHPCQREVRGWPARLPDHDRRVRIALAGAGGWPGAQASKRTLALARTVAAMGPRRHAPSAARRSMPPEHLRRGSLAGRAASSSRCPCRSAVRAQGPRPTPRPGARPT